MEQIVVKSEIQSSDEILLFYVDENGGNEEGVITTIDNMEQETDTNIQQIYIEENPEDIANEDLMQEEDIDDGTGERWAQFETKRLLIFYIDNKETFVSGATKEKFMWSVACKTMLTGRSPEICEIKLRSLKEQYAKAMIDQQNGVPVTWYLFEMAHQAFHDDPAIDLIINTQHLQEPEPIATVVVTKSEPIVIANDQVLSSNMITPSYQDVDTPVRANADKKVIKMLELYIKHKSTLQNLKWQKGIWETIALEMGELDGEYWHKRFMNFKNNYVRLLDKRKENGPESINWPYMRFFDEIFGDDPVFQKRYQVEPQKKIAPTESYTIIQRDQNDWNIMEMTVLAKYCFDSYSEFQDPTIPNNFLWNEVGRLIEKSAEICEAKYEELSNAHIDKYIAGGYSLANRVPIDIIFDSLISKETDAEMTKMLKEKKSDHQELWKTQEIDDLAQLFYENIEMFKDPICYYVCWAAVAKKLRRTFQSCHKQWQELVILYKSILDDKKENPDMQIDWRYIELFDRLFDYGMDEKLLEGYEMVKVREEREAEKNAKKETPNSPDYTEAEQNGTEDSDYDEKSLSKRSTGKAFKILEFYQKNKEKFTTSRKQALWEVLGKQIGMNATQCAHRFRNLKQVYTGYVQREINKPEMPIVWPYYQLCKKVFGYRALKNKLRNRKTDSDDGEEWSPKKIKQLIVYFSKNFNEVNEATDKTVWSELAADIGKSENACKDKFMELRKSYRKLKTMKTRNPAVNVTWKYFNMFDTIYRTKENGVKMEVETLEDYEMVQVDEDISQGIQEDDDIQCIFVIPENGNTDGTMANDTQQNPDTNEAEMQNAVTNEMETQNEFTNEMETQNAFTNEMETGNVVTNEMETQNEFTNKMETLTAVTNEMETQNAVTNEMETQNAGTNKMETQNAVTNEMETQNAETNEMEMYIAKTNEMDTSATDPNTEEKELHKFVTKWSKKSKKRLLILYLNYLKSHNGKEISAKEMWKEIAGNLTNKTPSSCKNIFAKLSKHRQNTFDEDVKKRSPYHAVFEKILALKPKFKKVIRKADSDLKGDKDVPMSREIVQQALELYLKNIEEFVSPRFEKKYAWSDLAKTVGEPVNKIFNKINYLKNSFAKNEDTPFPELLKEISDKESLLKTDEPSVPLKDTDETVTWSDDEKEQLLIWYLANLEKFKNPKYVRKYLWIESSNILNKSPLACSKMMSEIRTQYRTMVREVPDELVSWRFYDLCQKIYGTGKQKVTN